MHLKSVLSIVFVAATFLNPVCQTLTSHSKMGSVSKNILESMAFSLGGSADVKYGIDYYKITYLTPGTDDTLETASGMVAVPVIADCDEGLSVGIYEHGTVLHKQNVPSRDYQEANFGKVMAGIGMITVLPDYLGLGDNPGFHPYIHAETEATATIDAIRAARELCDILDLELNGDILITGYSQGGHAALATHEYISENNLISEFNIAGSAPCSGPYDMSGVQVGPLIQGIPYSNPGYVVYLLEGYNTAYGNLYDSIQEVLRPQYRQTVPGLLDGNSTMSQLNSALPSEIDSFLTADFMSDYRNAQSSKNHPLWQNLLDNDLYNWTPQKGVRLYYCTADEQVFYQNALIADSAFSTSGAQDVHAVDRGNHNHSNCVMPALSATLEYFDSLLVICGDPVIEQEDTNTLIEEYRASNKFNISVYPNPAQTHFRIGSENNSPKTVTVYDQKGTFMQEWNLFPRDRVFSVAEWPSGMYFIKAVDESGNTSVEKFIKR